MYFYCSVKDGYIMSVGMISAYNPEDKGYISEERYMELVEAFQSKPEAPDGYGYSADVEGLEIGVGTEIVLIPQSTNQAAATLALNGGEAYPLCLRPGWNVTGDDLHPQLTLPLEAGMLLRGGEYIFRFDGAAWVLQSYISLIGGGGCKIYVSDTMPENLSPGDGWVDTSEELETPVTQGQMETYVNDVFAAIEEIDGTPLDLSGITANSGERMFELAKKLREVRFKGSIPCNLKFPVSPLSKDSILSVFSCLSADVSGKTLTINKEAVDKAFETSPGAADGSTSAEWLALVAAHSNWTISLV